MDIVVDDLSRPEVANLLALHLSGMHQNSPAGSVHALDLSSLRADDVTVWTAWTDDRLMGIGALKALDSRCGEIKSMRTDPAHLRKGVGLSILNHVIAVAKQRGYQTLSLETGSGTEFEPALCLYRNRGFTNGPAFGDYQPSAFNQFLHLQL